MATREEVDAVLRSFRQQITEDDLDSVVGGNDGPKGKSKEGIAWTCPLCGAHMTLYNANDGPKHVTKDCPKNPYK